MGLGQTAGHDARFRGTATTPEVIEKELGSSRRSSTRQFLAALDAETKKTVEGFDDWRKKMREIAELAKAKKNDEVIREATAIRDLYPDYVEAGSVYEFLADAYLAKNDKPNAIAELERYAKVGGREPGLIRSSPRSRRGRHEEGSRRRAGPAQLHLAGGRGAASPAGRSVMDDGQRGRRGDGIPRRAGHEAARRSSARYNLARAYRSAGKTDRSEGRTAAVARKPRRVSSPRRKCCSNYRRKRTENNTCRHWPQRSRTPIS